MIKRFFILIIALLFTSNAFCENYIKKNYGISRTFADGRYLKLDCSNDPLTGDLEGPDFKITDMSLGMPTYSTLGDAFNMITSAGRLTGGVITDAGSETVNVSAGTGLIRIADDDVSQVKFFDIPETNGLAIPTDTTRYIVVEYNSGTPRVVVYTAETWDLDTSFPLGKVTNEATELHINNNPWWVGDGLTNVIERLQAMGHMVRDAHIGGLILSVTGTRNVAVTAGTLWSRLSEFPITALDTSSSGTFEYYWYNGVAGTWNKSNATQYSVTEWNDTTLATLQTINNNKYCNIWVYAEADDNTIAVLYPQAQYNTAAEAGAVGAPTVVPTHIAENGILIGKIIIKQGVNAPIEVLSAFTNVFSASLAADHGNLTGLSDNDHPQYLLTDGTNSDDTTGDFDFFKNLSIGAGTNGKSVRVYRNADYLEFLTASSGVATVTGSASLWLGAGASSDGTIFLGGNPIIGQYTNGNRTLKHYGYITTGGLNTEKYVQWQVDANGSYKLTREDANITDVDIGFPLLLNSTVTQSAASGVWTLGGIGGTNNENITLDFESSADTAKINTTSGLTQIVMADNVGFGFGLGNDCKFLWQTAGKNDFLELGLSCGSAGQSGYFSIMERADLQDADRYPSGTTVDPVLRIYSSDATSATDYIEFYHNQTDGIINVGGGSISSTSAWDLSAASLEIPNAAAPTVDATGEIAFDTDVITQGLMLVYGSAAVNYVVATTDTPGDNEIPKYDAGTGTITWEADAGGAGSPGGADGDIQYNNGGSFGGFGDFNDGTNALTLPGSLTTAGATTINMGLTVNNGNGGSADDDFIVNSDNVASIFQIDASADKVMLANSRNISGLKKHLRFTIIDPLAVQTEDNEVCLWPETDAAITVTKITVTLDANANEVAGDLKYADTFIGLANATVINAFDTSSGVLEDDTITSGAVAAGKCIYLSFDSAPNTAIKQMCVDVEYDYD